MNHQEKRRETIHDVIGQMTDGYLEEAANDSAVFRGETVGARRRKAVLKWVVVAAAALLIVSGMVFAAVVREKARRPSGPSSTTEDRVEAPAVLQYASNGDGTCRVIGITNPTKADFVTVTVPAEYNGEKVTAYEPANIALPYPEGLSAEAFSLLLDKMAAAINADSVRNGYTELNRSDYETAALWNRMAKESGNSLWEDFAMFRAYFALLTAEDCANDAKKAELREKYPDVVNTDLYVVAEDITLAERLRLSGILLKILPEYSAKDKFADEMSIGRTRGETVVSTQITEVNLPAGPDSAEGLKTVGNETVLPLVYTSIRDFSCPDSVFQMSRYSLVGCRKLQTVAWLDDVGADAFVPDILEEGTRILSPDINPAAIMIPGELN